VLSTTGTRGRILDAALACFVEDGYERASIVRIRERSGVSNGALFHHFHTKEALADALYVEAIASFQEGLWALLQTPARSLRTAVQKVLAHQLRWTEEHADLARFVYSRGHLEWDSPAAADVAALNRDLAAAFREWMSPWIDTGALRPMSMLLLSAIVSGPAHAIARRWLAGELERPPSAFVDDLSRAACAALSGEAVASLSAAGTTAAVATLPPIGRVRLELLSDGGVVLAHGAATADLVFDTDADHAAKDVMSSPSDPTCRDLLSSSAERVRAGVQTVELEEAPCKHRNGT
jgi:AcrR family transcriptional regulator